MKILIATKNPAKFFDLKNSFKNTSYQFVNLTDLKIADEVIETGKSFEENARLKAGYYAKKSGLPTIADDGGIEIDALNGEPGVKTRRWIDNRKASDEQLIKYTLIRLYKFKGQERAAQLRAIICLALPNGITHEVEGKIRGIIAEKPYKTYKKGFPFDALLYFPDKKKYYYELKYGEKNPVNHRTIAIQKMKPIFKSLFK